MAEVHIFGQILGASRFPRRTLFCKWAVRAGGAWRIVSGNSAGQTHVDNPQYEEMTCWCHPFDIHFATASIQGWPKLYFEVFHQDELGRNEVYGYGCVHVPSSAGHHVLKCVTWRPVGTAQDQFTQFFIGGGQKLKGTHMVHSGLDRYRLQTESMGIVHVDLNVVLYNFGRFVTGS